MADTTTGNPRNVLVFFCDQLRLDLLRCYGGSILRTPNLDRLAADGTVFERAYTPTAICSPARASLMTGLYPHRHHLFNNTTRGYSYCFQLRPEVPMISDWAARNTPHQTAYTGKWHLGGGNHYANSAFHVKKGIYSHPGGVPEVLRDLVPGHAGTMAIPMGEFPDVKTAENTKAFLRERDRSRPFLAFCAFPGPHEPWRVPEEYGIRYDAEEMPIWANRCDPLEGKPLNQKRLRLRGRKREVLADAAGRDRQLQTMIACHLSYMELIDSLMGEVLQTLEDTGCAQDTTIIFTADHGDMLGAHGLWSKGAYMYDEIYRIPLVIREPGRKAGRTDKLVNLMDVTATIMHLMSGRTWDAMTDPAQWAPHDELFLQGQSLLPLMDGGAWSRRVHYAEYHGDWYGHYTSRMVTDGRYKVVWNASDLCEMYDLASDPHELNNVFYRTDYHPVRDEYLDLLVAEAKRLKDGHAYGANAEIEKQPLI